MSDGHMEREETGGPRVRGPGTSARAAWLLPVVTAALLVVGLVGLRGWERTPERVPASPPPPGAAAVPPGPAAVPARAEPRGPAMGAPPAHTALPRSAEGPATVVPITAADEVPEPEVPGTSQELPPPPEELPQSPEWKHQKTVHVRALLERQVERLEAERAEAARRGDGEEAARLRVLAERQRARVSALQAEAEQLRPEAAAAPATAGAPP